MLVVFTDGVTEARDPGGVHYTEERLLALLEEPGMTASELLDEIEKSVLAHTRSGEPSDDITLMAVRRKAEGA